MARLGGFEPPTNSLEVYCSIQLSYRREVGMLPCDKNNSKHRIRATAGPYPCAPSGGASQLQPVMPCQGETTLDQQPQQGRKADHGDKAFNDHCIIPVFRLRHQ